MALGFGPGLRFRAPALTTKGVHQLGWRPRQDFSTAFGSNGVRPTNYSVWNNQLAFNDWQQALPGDDPRRQYTYANRDIDEDGILDAVVTDGRGVVRGVNGIRFNRPNWGSKVNWINAQGQRENYYEKKYTARKSFNSSELVSSLKDIKADFNKLVISKIMTGYDK
jgi:hypothetical protein